MIMKIRIFQILMLTSICSKLIFAQNLASVKISGKIENPTADNVSITDLGGKEIAKTFLDGNNSFNLSFNVETNYYKFKAGTESTRFFLDTGFDLYITLDTDSFDETVDYKGFGSDINNYLATKYLFQEKWGNLDYYAYYFTLDETDFLHLVDSLHQTSLDLLNSIKLNNQEFIKLERAGFDNYKTYKLGMYQSAHRNLAKMPDFEVSMYFPNPWEDFDINTSDNINAAFYLGNIRSYFEHIIYANSNDVSFDYVLTIIKMAGDSIKNAKVRDAMLYQFCKYRLTKSKELDKSFELYKRYANNPEHISEIEKIYLARKKTQTGEISPSFSFEDINGKLVTNEDLKGKLLYIDVWATWCGPCLREIPYFDTLQRQFEGRKIQFVSISYQDNKERWQKMVKEKELLGIQLFAADSKAPFFTDYQVEGIPRYILIDDKGIIIDSDAKRPSDNELKNFLNTQLQKLEE